MNRVKRIVKVMGMVNAESDFTQYSQVITGFSNLMVEVFETRGKHARAAVGMGSLPGNIPVKIEEQDEIRTVLPAAVKEIIISVFSVDNLFVAKE